MIDWLAANREWILSGLGLFLVSLFIKMAGNLKSRWEKKCKVLVHEAYFIGGYKPHYFIKVINISKEDVEITHLWIETIPRIHVMNNKRPLPFRLKPNETWETWIEKANIPAIRQNNIYKMVRVMLSTGQVYSSKHNANVPIKGYVAGSKEVLRGEDN